MSKMPRDQIAAYVAPSGTDVLTFNVFLSSPTDCAELRAAAEAAVTELNSTYPYDGATMLRASSWPYISYGVGAPTQADIEAQLHVSLPKHQIVLGFADQRLGEYTRIEMRTAVELPGPRPFTLFFIARNATPVDWRDQDRRAARNELVAFAHELEQVHDGVVHDFAGPGDFRQVVADALRKYLNRHLAARQPVRHSLAASKQAWPEHVSPYPGLTSMRFDDRGRFFGRDEELDAFERLLDNGRRVLFVRGPSGIGKSSLLMAGLMPRLAARAAPGTAALIANLADGEGSAGEIDPFLALAHAGVVSGTMLQSLVGDVSGDVRRLADRLRDTELGLVEALSAHRVLNGSSTRLVLCLDQAELLTSRCKPEDVRRFSAALSRSIQAGSLTLLATWRDDEEPQFFDLDAFAILRALSDGHTHSLGRLTRRGLVRAIREPARLAGYDIEQLIEPLADDAAAEPNSLPLLAAALYDIHQRWHARWQGASEAERPPRIYTRDLYAGLAAVIDRAADKALALANDAELAALERLFWRTVHFDVGRGRAVAVRLARSALADDADLAAVIDRLVNARLLLSAASTVEFAHSRVLELWQRLADWIAARQADLELLAYLSLRAARWQHLRRDHAHLLSWEECKAAGELLRRVRGHLDKSDPRVRQVDALARESLRIRGLLEGIKMVEFGLISGGLAANARLTEDECDRYWPFYKALTGDDDTPFSDAEKALVANRGFRPAHFAAFANNVAMLQRLRMDRDALHAASAGGWTPLHMATYAGALQATDLLVRAGAALDSLTQDGLSPLALACRGNHGAVVDHLLARGASPDGGVSAGNEPPLIAAIGGNDTAIVARLLAHGADASACSADGSSPLHVAYWCSDAGLVGMLLAHGAARDARDGDGLTPLHRAALDGNSVVVEQLLDHRCDPLARTVPTKTHAHAGHSALHLAAGIGALAVCTQLLARAPALRDAPDDNGATPLHASASGGHAAVIAALLDAGADLSARDTYGETALSRAARAGSLESIPLFHARFGGDLLGPAARSGEPKSGHGGTAGWTALHHAAAAGRRDACVLLLDLAPALLEQVDDLQRSALHAAASSGQAEIVALLAQHGALPSAQADDGLQALHLAAANGHADVCRWLVDKGEVDCNVPGPKEVTALLLALTGKRARAEREERALIVRTLLALGADPNRGRLDGETALHLAVRANDVDLVDVLLKAKADVHARDDGEQTALETALAMERETCGSLLRWVAPGTVRLAPVMPWMAVPDEARRRAMAAVAALTAPGAAAAKWLPIPTFDRPWEELPRDELIELLATLDAWQAYDAKPRTLDARVLTGARRMPLAFYPGFSLVELSLTAEPGLPPQHCVQALLWGPRAEFTLPIEAPRSIYLLDGQAGAMHTLSCRLPIRLATEADAAMFLQLFCSYLMGDEDTFITVNAFAELALPDAHARSAWRHVEALIEPLRCVRADDDSFDFEATVLYRQRLFKTELRVGRWGFVEMREDQFLTMQPMPTSSSRWTEDRCRIVSSDLASGSPS